MERFEDIEGWKMARELTKLIYSAARQPDFSRDFGLRDQIQRATGSVMHNIAEGFDGGSNAEFAKFLRYAQRSCIEVKSQLYVALDLSYITQAKFEELYSHPTQTHSVVGGFIRYLNKKTN